MLRLLSCFETRCQEATNRKMMIHAVSSTVIFTLRLVVGKDDPPRGGSLDQH